MEMFFLWRVNSEKKSFILTDHDPNSTRYSYYTIEELELKLKVSCHEQFPDFEAKQIDNSVTIPSVPLTENRVFTNETFKSIANC